MKLGHETGFLLPYLADNSDHDANNPNRDRLYKVHAAIKYFD